ncbi:MAG: hypothetical protein ACRDHF_12490 [Tepidiformaceae bacterium]
MTTRRPKVIHLVAVQAASLAVVACGSDPVVFRFAPEEGAVYRIRETEEVQATTTARAGIELERTEAEARMEVTRPDSWRWGFVITIERMTAYDRGVQLTAEHPGLGAFIGTPLTVEVWEDGTVGALKGTDGIERKLMAAAGRTGEPPVLGLAFAREMEAAVREDWAERVAALVGREAAVDDRWEQKLEGRLPSGGTLTLIREFHFEGWEECGSARCARLAYTDRGGGAEWSGPLERAINEFGRSLCPNAQQVEVLEVSLTGQGQRLVEPSRLFTYRDRGERRFDLRVRIDGGEERGVSRVETKTLEAERLDREEV